MVGRCRGTPTSPSRTTIETGRGRSSYVTRLGRRVVCGPRQGSTSHLPRGAERPWKSQGRCGWEGTKRSLPTNHGAILVASRPRLITPVRLAWTRGLRSIGEAQWHRLAG